MPMGGRVMSRGVRPALHGRRAASEHQASLTPFHPRPHHATSTGRGRADDALEQRRAAVALARAGKRESNMLESWRRYGGVRKHVLSTPMLW